MREVSSDVTCERVSPVAIPSLPDTEGDMEDLVTWMGEVTAGVTSEHTPDTGSAVCIRSRGLYSTRWGYTYEHSQVIMITTVQDTDCAGDLHLLPHDQGLQLPLDRSHLPWTEAKRGF